MSSAELDKGVDAGIETGSPAQQRLPFEVEALGVPSSAAAARPPARATPAPLMSEEQKVAMLEEVVRAIERIHGRIGKILLAQYLSGSQKSKIQKRNLHRWRVGGMFRGLRQIDGTKTMKL